MPQTGQNSMIEILPRFRQLTPDTDQRDVSDTIKLLSSIEANDYDRSMIPVKEKETMEFVLKKDKETPGTWRFKENKDERPLTIYLTKDQVKELGDPTSIIVTIG